jgi:hypothetical protein
MMNSTRRKRPQGPARRRRPAQQAQNMLNQAVISHPPEIQDYQVRHSTRLRFVANAAFDGNITFQNLLDLILIATTAVIGDDVFVMVKVRRVQLWAVPVIGNAANVRVVFGGQTAGIVGDNKLHSDTSMGVQPAHVSARPSKRSLASEYQVSSTAVAFNLSVPTGAVADVELSFCGGFGQALQAQNGLVGATVGAMLLRGLDGLAKATSAFTPIDTDVWI